MKRILSIKAEKNESSVTLVLDKGYETFNKDDIVDIRLKMKKRHKGTIVFTMSSKIYSFRINEDILDSVYQHFKEFLQEYLPKEGEIIFQNTVANRTYWLKNAILMIFCTIIVWLLDRPSFFLIMFILISIIFVFAAIVFFILKQFMVRFRLTGLEYLQELSSQETARKWAEYFCKYYCYEERKKIIQELAKKGLIEFDLEFAEKTNRNDFFRPGRYEVKKYSFSEAKNILKEGGFPLNLKNRVAGFKHKVAEELKEMCGHNIKLTDKIFFAALDAVNTDFFYSSTEYYEEYGVTFYYHYKRDFTIKEPEIENDKWEVSRDEYSDIEYIKYHNEKIFIIDHISSVIAGSGTFEKTIDFFKNRVGGLKHGLYPSKKYSKYGPFIVAYLNDLILKYKTQYQNGNKKYEGDFKEGNYHGKGKTIL